MVLGGRRLTARLLSRVVLGPVRPGARACKRSPFSDEMRGMKVKEWKCLQEEATEPAAWRRPKAVASGRVGPAAIDGSPRQRRSGRVVYGSSPVKRHRRTKADMNGIAAQIAEAIASDDRMTVRQRVPTWPTESRGGRDVDRSTNASVGSRASLPGRSRRGCLLDHGDGHFEVVEVLVEQVVRERGHRRLAPSRVDFQPLVNRVGDRQLPAAALPDRRGARKAAGFPWSPACPPLSPSAWSSPSSPFLSAADSPSVFRIRSSDTMLLAAMLENLLDQLRECFGRPVMTARTPGILRDGEQRFPQPSGRRESRCQKPDPGISLLSCVSRDWLTAFFWALVRTSPTTFRASWSKFFLIVSIVPFNRPCQRSHRFRCRRARSRPKLP